MVWTCVLEVGGEASCRLLPIRQPRQAKVRRRILWAILGHFRRNHRWRRRGSGRFGRRVRRFGRVRPERPLGRTVLRMEGMEALPS